jgi:hypothetical protein
MPMPVKKSPAATPIQKVVERSRSVKLGRWTSAAPSARSEKTRTRLEKIRAMPASPKSRGERRRAITTATAIRESWRTI